MNNDKRDLINQQNSNEQGLASQQNSNEQGLASQQNSNEQDIASQQNSNEQDIASQQNSNEQDIANEQNTNEQDLANEQNTNEQDLAKELQKEEQNFLKEQKRIDKQKQIHPLRYKKAGVLLTRAEVAKIKASRKKLREKMKNAGITDPADKKLLEVTSGAYFDKPKWIAAIARIFRGRVLVALLLTLVVALSSMFMLSEITKMKGHFTVNITEDLFDKGFSIGDSIEKDKIKNPTSYLKGDELENTPCTSISQISKDVDKLDGSNNGGDYFSYTFYIQNKSGDNANYGYELVINSESKDASKIAWVLLFIDGKAAFYAKADKNGEQQTLPHRDDNTRGYREPPFYDVAAFPELQYEIIDNPTARYDYYRLIALPFESDTVITSGKFSDMEPGIIHKYTVVSWIEGDDPDCTNDMIGGHFGLEFNFVTVD